MARACDRRKLKLFKYFPRILDNSSKEIFSLQNQFLRHYNLRISFLLSDKQTDRQTDGQMDRNTDGWKFRWIFMILLLFRVKVIIEEWVTFLTNCYPFVRRRNIITTFISFSIHSSLFQICINRANYCLPYSAFNKLLRNALKRGNIG